MNGIEDLLYVATRLIRVFAQAAPQTMEKVVDAIHEEFRGARLRTYLPEFFGLLSGVTCRDPCGRPMACGMRRVVG
ncbi:three-helix bundle dimerization domain-containing protein [Streptomyces sp. NPDC001153]